MDNFVVHFPRHGNFLSTLWKIPPQKNTHLTPPPKTPQNRQKHRFLTVFDPFWPPKRPFLPLFRPFRPQNLSTPWNSRVQSQSPTCWTHGEREVYSARRMPGERARLRERSGNIFRQLFHAMEKTFPRRGIFRSGSPSIPRLRDGCRRFPCKVVGAVRRHLLSAVRRTWQRGKGFVKNEGLFRQNKRRSFSMMPLRGCSGWDASPRRPISHIKSFRTRLPSVPHLRDGRRRFLWAFGGAVTRK